MGSIFSVVDGKSSGFALSSCLDVYIDTHHIVLDNHFFFCPVPFTGKNRLARAMKAVYKILCRFQATVQIAFSWNILAGVFDMLVLVPYV